MCIVLNLQGFPIAAETGIPGCVDVSTQTLTATMRCIIRADGGDGECQTTNEGNGNECTSAYATQHNTDENTVLHVNV